MSVEEYICSFLWSSAIENVNIYKNATSETLYLDFGLFIQYSIHWRDYNSNKQIYFANSFEWTNG